MPSHPQHARPRSTSIKAARAQAVVAGTGVAAAVRPTAWTGPRRCKRIALTFDGLRQLAAPVPGTRVGACSAHEPRLLGVPPRIGPMCRCPSPRRASGRDRAVSRGTATLRIQREAGSLHRAVAPIASRARRAAQSRLWCASLNSTGATRVHGCTAAHTATAQASAMIGPLPQLQQLRSSAPEARLPALNPRRDGRTLALAARQPKPRALPIALRAPLRPRLRPRASRVAR